jgi:hypothetical protein
MTNKLFAIAAFSLIASVASADHPHGLTARDSAGVWTGLASGTFQGQPYASLTTVTISHDGQTAIAQDDSTLGPLTGSCVSTGFSSEGIAGAHCIMTAGVAVGAEYDVHFVLTQYQEHLKLWISNPAMFITSDLTHP